MSPSIGPLWGAAQVTLNGYASTTRILLVAGDSNTNVVGNAMLTNFAMVNANATLLTPSVSNEEAQLAYTSLSNVDDTPKGIGASCTSLSGSDIVVCVGGWTDTRDDYYAASGATLFATHVADNISSISWTTTTVSDLQRPEDTWFTQYIGTNVGDLPVADATLHYINGTLILYGGRSACYHDVALTDSNSTSLFPSTIWGVSNTTSEDVTVFQRSITLNVDNAGGVDDDDLQENLTMDYVRMSGKGTFGHCSIVIDDSQMFTFFGARPSLQSKEGSSSLISFENGVISRVVVDTTTLIGYSFDVTSDATTIPSGRVYPACTTDGTSKVFVAGGVTDFEENKVSGEIWSIDLSNVAFGGFATWSLLANISSDDGYLPTYRGSITYDPIDDETGFLLLYGGMTESGEVSSSVLSINTATGDIRIASPTTSNGASQSNSTSTNSWMMQDDGHLKWEYLVFPLLAIVLLLAIAAFLYEYFTRKKRSKLDEEHGANHEATKAFDNDDDGVKFTKVASGHTLEPTMVTLYLTHNPSATRFDRDLFSTATRYSNEQPFNKQVGDQEMDFEEDKYAYGFQRREVSDTMIAIETNARVSTDRTGTSDSPQRGVSMRREQHKYWRPFTAVESSIITSGSSRLIGTPPPDQGPFVATNDVVQSSDSYTTHSTRTIIGSVDSAHVMINEGGDEVNGTHIRDTRHQNKASVSAIRSLPLDSPTSPTRSHVRLGAGSMDDETSYNTYVPPARHLDQKIILADLPPELLSHVSREPITPGVLDINSERLSIMSSSAMLQHGSQTLSPPLVPSVTEPEHAQHQFALLQLTPPLGNRVDTYPYDEENILALTNSTFPNYVNSENMLDLVVLGDSPEKNVYTTIVHDQQTIASSATGRDTFVTARTRWDSPERASTKPLS